MEYIKIELSIPDAELFKDFMKNREDIRFLFEKDINGINFFNFKKGYSMIHRDETGKIRKVEYHIVPYTK